jgi:TonB family protein
MSRFWIVALLGALGIGSIRAQQATLPEPALKTRPATSAAEIVDLGPDVTAPILIPRIVPSFDRSSCGKKSFQGKVTFSFVVDAEGVPSKIIMLTVLGNDLDRLAILILASDRFKPGTRGGIPVAVREAAEIRLHACVSIQEESGKLNQRIGVDAQPEQSFGKIPKSNRDEATVKEQPAKGVTAPVPLNNVEASYTDEARKAQIEGMCIVSVVIDSYGFPQNPRLMKSLDAGLDLMALEAVEHYRFRPAMKDGQPVPVMISIEVNFRLH